MLLYMKNIKPLATTMRGNDAVKPIQSLNLGANAYLLKPVNPKKLLKVVKEKLSEQEEAEKMSQDKVRKWIETRVMKLKNGEA